MYGKKELLLKDPLKTMKHAQILNIFEKEERKK
jgi:hypothetical protein